MTELGYHFAALEYGLVTLLDELSSLTADDRATFRLYLEKNEFGLAFEGLCESIARERLRISPAQYDKLVELQNMMELDSVAETVRDLVTRDRS